MRKRTSTIAEGSRRTALERRWRPGEPAYVQDSLGRFYRLRQVLGELSGLLLLQSLKKPDRITLADLEALVRADLKAARVAGAAAPASMTRLETLLEECGQHLGNALRHMSAPVLGSTEVRQALQALLLAQRQLQHACRCLPGAELVAHSCACCGGSGPEPAVTGSADYLTGV